MAKYVGILLIAAVLAPAQARAGWEYVGESASGSVFIMDTSTKRQQGKYTLVWTGLEFPEGELINGKRFSSVRALDVYDCSDYRFGTKTEVYYTGKAGSGDVVHSVSMDMDKVKFMDVVPNTMAETMLKKACSKAK